MSLFSSMPSSVIPFTLRQGMACNILFETPHVGQEVPEELHGHRELLEAARRRWDRGVGKAAEYLLETAGGEWLGAVYSRLVVDLNRGADRVDSRVCPHWPRARRHEDGGVIVPFTREEGRFRMLYSVPLESEEIEHRLRTYWFPYHDSLHARLKTIRNRFGEVLLISLHSTQPSPEHRSGDNPVIYLGTCNGTTSDSDRLTVLQRILENHSITVVTKGFYQGAFTTQAYGIESGIHAIQIELDRREKKNGDFFRSQLEPLAEGLKAISRQQSASTSKSKTSPISRRSGLAARTYWDPLSDTVYPW